MIQVRKMIRAPDTVLGDAGREWDLLMSEDLEDWELDSDVVRVIDAVCTAHRPWDWDLRRKHFQDDETIRKKNDDEKASGGSSFTFVFRHLYKPDEGMFAIIPEDMVKVTGSYLEPILDFGSEIDLAPGDFVYLTPLKTLSTGDLKPSRSLLLEMAEVVSIGDKEGLVVNLLSRPDSKQAAWNEVLQGDGGSVTVKRDRVVSKCSVVSDRSRLVWDSSTGYFDNTFVKSSTPLSTPSQNSCPSNHKTTILKPLATLDVFAGCGGLSRGLHQSGVAVSRWAIENDPNASAAYHLNNPGSMVYSQDCSMLLEAAMRTQGLDNEIVGGSLTLPSSISSSQALLQRDLLPLPGEVDFIVGGPPCQGFSILNQTPNSESSLMKNALVSTFLSYCDYYRPRYFLLKNVRSFSSHDKGRTLGLALQSLLTMGYAVRVGILNAGGFAVPQSRRRLFIWAAAPDAVLPDFPTPLHAHDIGQIQILKLRGQRSKLEAFPFRAVTVDDAISDLPSISNGHQIEDPIDHPPEKRLSAYQKFIQGGAGSKITDHICKEMNELDLERCIPDQKFKGADLIPTCLRPKPRADNKPSSTWKGLFGRLDSNSIFPTLTTAVGPMRKMGCCLHPSQDRIISLREAARGQGFPDDHKFSGSLNQRHKQVGNAVPPPLGKALGLELKKVMSRGPPPSPKSKGGPKASTAEPLA